MHEDASHERLREELHIESGEHRKLYNGVLSPGLFPVKSQKELLEGQFLCSGMGSPVGPMPESFKERKGGCGYPQISFTIKLTWERKGWSKEIAD